MSNDIIGTRIGIYDVLYECEDRASDGHKLYHVKCIICEREFDMIKSQIGKAKHCAHIGLGGAKIAFSSKYSWANPKLAKIFLGMKKRCYKSSDKSYRWYGAKGIKICDEWLNNPKLFEDWAFASGYSDGLTIDRIKEDLDYCPENCRWITASKNSKYKSTTRMITVCGISKTGREWSDFIGIGTNTINNYVRKYGINNTIEFIEKYIKNPTLQPKGGQSYYDLYMTT